MKNILVLIGFLFASYSFALDTESQALVLAKSFNDAQEKARTASDTCFLNFENNDNYFFEKSSEEKVSFILHIFKTCSLKGAQAITTHLANDASFIKIMEELGPQKKNEFDEFSKAFPNQILIPVNPQGALKNYITYMKQTLDTHSKHVFARLSEILDTK